MKLIFSLCSLLILLSSCSQEEQVFSCDKAINTWVTNNIEDIHNMSRKDWLKKSPSVSTAIYRAFSPEQRKAFWKDKFLELRSLEWSKEEISHLCKLEDFAFSHTFVFSGEVMTENQQDEIELFFYKWQKEAIEKFGWSKKLCIAIVATGYSLKDKTGEIVVPQDNALKIQTMSDKGKDCGCNVTYDFCPIGRYCDKNACDNVSSVGCGILLSSSCNGMCA